MKRRTLDLCAGSGILAVLAASCGAEEVTAIDASHRAVLAVRINAALNGVKVHSLRGDLFSPVRGLRFDLIACNPPYVPGKRAELPRRGASRAWEGGPDGRAFIDRICGEVAGHLHPGGVLLLVHSAVCGERQTIEALSAKGLTTSVVARHHGRMGPRMRARAAWMQERGLPAENEQEEMIVFRAQRPVKPPSNSFVEGE